MKAVLMSISEIEHDEKPEAWEAWKTEEGKMMGLGKFCIERVRRSNG